MKVLWLYSNMLNEVILYDSIACTGEYKLHKMLYDHAVNHRDEVGWYDVVVIGASPDRAAHLCSEEMTFFRTRGKVIYLHPEASEGPFSKCYWVMDNSHDALIHNIDGSLDWRGMEKGITTLTPVNPAHYLPNTPWAERKYTCGTSCGDANPVRKAILGPLADVLVWRGPDPNPDTVLTYTGYADFVKDCRATLNLSEHGQGGGRHHVKGRVIEAALAGSLLIEQLGSPTHNWFELGVDFLQYESVDHARELIARVDVDPECEKMARRLHERVMAEHHPIVVWRKVFAAL